MCTCTRAQGTALEFWNSLKGLNKEELKLKLKPIIEDLIRKLKVNKTNLSSYVRKHNSAPNHRKTSKDIGIVGITFMSAAFGVIFIVDILWARQLAQKKKQKRQS